MADMKRFKVRRYEIMKGAKCPATLLGQTTCILNRKLCSSDRDSWSKRSPKSFRLGLVDSTKIFFLNYLFKNAKILQFKSTV